MTYNGADDGAKKALETILGIDDESLDAFNEANAALVALQDGLDPKVTLAIANSIWVASGQTLDSEFVERIADHYAGKMANLDSRHPARQCG